MVLLAKEEEEEELRKIEKAKMDKPRALDILKVDPEEFQELLKADKKEEVSLVLLCDIIFRVDFCDRRREKNFQSCRADSDDDYDQIANSFTGTFQG